MRKSVRRLRKLVLKPRRTLREVVVAVVEVVVFEVMVLVVEERELLGMMKTQRKAPNLV
jgi:hypothetical protein